MKKKIAYIVFFVIIIVALIITAVKGLKVDIYYAEGTLITFNAKTDIEISDIKAIAREVWPNQQLVVQRVELFGDSASIKVKEVSDDDLNTLCSKINEKYSKELTTSDFTTEHVSNVKLSNIVEPYILPIGLSILIILGYYAVRYRGAKQMLNLLKYTVIAEVLLYSVHAICRIPVNTLTMPFALIIYTMILIIYTTYNEIKQSK